MANINFNIIKMVVEINTKHLANNKITPDQYILLTLLYHKEYEDIEKVFGRNKAMTVRNSLIYTKYLLSAHTKFKETTLSQNAVKKLLRIKSDKINFWTFYIEYPIKVGSRVLRAASPDSQLALKHEKKYLTKIKNIKEHKLAIKAVNAYISRQRLVNKLQYLPAMETVLNNNLWEQWEGFIESTGKEGASWNTTTI
jgi:hypothetical protein